MTDSLWDPGEDDVLVCRQVRDETHDVKTFTFAPRTPRRFAFTPGQFLTLDLEIDGQPINRCYTIASSPARPFRVSITVKRVPGGPVSNWLHDHLVPGMALRATGPHGAFTSAGHPPGKFLFLSGGSGITPLMSMARFQHDLAEAADTVFVHAARSPADIIFRQEQALLSRALPGFRAVAVCEADAPGEAWGGYRGRLSLAMLRLIAPDFLERRIFTCGPGLFMAGVRALLGEAGFAMARYHEESFVFEDLPAAEQEAVVEAEAASFRIEFTKSGKVVECPAGTTILAAARHAGLRLPSSCTKGICGTCKSRMVSGRVDMVHGGGIRQREIDQGQILLCCSKPLADLVIEK